ncbi:hypothetical protein F2Q68_00042778 [Brassica cretica]|uniref:Malectin-like domain-containing protein n=1 Tax=Brassica cretica TaxID=69181 RepID=A0A8S9MF85_BRACR|nr:hypothetical protein F2Q68_00042778 [Brassica cretica]
MPFLSFLDLNSNHLIDSLETMNCSSSSKLERLFLGYNRLNGRILEPLSKLTNLKYLNLASQNTTDPINFVSSLGFKSLEELHLFRNAISRINIGSPNLNTLYLNNCSINEFPTFIKNLQNLEYLQMRNNRLKGEVPKWLWSMPSLIRLSLSHNSLDSFEGSPTMLLNSSLGWLDLRSNAFRGPLPIISQETYLFYCAIKARPTFTGSLPHDYFVNWSTLLISIPPEERDMYVGYGFRYSYYPSMFLRNKGINMELEKILLTYNLCGPPLEKSCFGDKAPSTPEAQEPEPPKQEQVLNWKAAAMGYGPGVLFGLAIGQVLYSFKPVLFFKLFRI